MRLLPKITVITPSYNQGGFIEETILSVLNQNYPNLEFIIIDGGSNDNTIEIIKKYSGQISYWESSPDKGTYDANNKALARMSGQYWCVVNSDDILLPGALDEVAEAIQNHNWPDWISSPVAAIDSASNIKQYLKPVRPKPIAGYSFLNNCWIYHPGTFLSTKVYEQIGTFAPVDIMDYDYWIRMEIKGYKPIMLDQPLAGLRYHTDCKSYDFLDMYKKIIALLKKYELDLKPSLSESNVKQLSAHIHDFTIHYYTRLILSQIFNKQKIRAFASLMVMFYHFPELLFKKWMFGFVLNFIRPVKESDFNPHHSIV